MTNPKRPRIHFQSFESPEFWVGDYAKFASAVGYATWAWNALHADLCDLFWTITDIQEPYVPRAIWHAVRSDAGQRKVLLEAATARLVNDQEALNEINWLKREVDAIALFRNDATHTLWTVLHDPRADPCSPNYWSSRRAVPDVERGNPRGKRLEGQSVEEVLLAFAGYCMTLIQFSRAIDIRVGGSDEGDPLPQRPERPSALTTR